MAPRPMSQREVLVKKTITFKIKPREPMACVMGPMHGKTVQMPGNVTFFRVAEEGVGHHRYKRIGNVLYYLGVEEPSADPPISCSGE